jgi:hypothetical protein
MKAMMAKQPAPLMEKVMLPAMSGTGDRDKARSP